MGRCRRAGGGGKSGKFGRQELEGGGVTDFRDYGMFQTLSKYLANITFPGRALLEARQQAETLAVAALTCRDGDHGVSFQG